MSGFQPSTQAPRLFASHHRASLNSNTNGNHLSNTNAYYKSDSGESVSQDSDSSDDVDPEDEDEFDGMSNGFKPCSRSLGIGENYLPSWGGKEAFRELYQNWYGELCHLYSALC